MLATSWVLQQNTLKVDTEGLKEVPNSENTVDERNPANQLRLIVYAIIYRVLYIPSDYFWISEPSTPAMMIIPLWTRVTRSWSKVSMLTN